MSSLDSDRRGKMGSIVRYAAVNTKVKSLEGKLMSEEEFERLLDTKNYEDAFKFLKEETHYNEVLKDYNAEDVHRGQLEIILKKHYISVFRKLSHYFSGDYKKLFKILYMKYEIEDLKVILRGKYVNKDNEYLRSIVCYESTLSTLDYNELINAKTLEECVETLKGTDYYASIINLLPSVEKEGLFRLEMELDFVYFSSLRKFIKKLDKEDMEVIEKLNGVNCDLLNIEWILRGKKYYNLSPEELLNYTIYDKDKLKRDKLKVLCYTKDLNEFYEVLSSLPYGKIFSENINSEYLIEKGILSYLRKTYKNQEKKNPISIATVSFYLEIYLLEVRDVITTIENKRYKSDNSEIKKYISATL